MKSAERIRRIIVAAIVLAVSAFVVWQHPELQQQIQPAPPNAEQNSTPKGDAAETLETLAVKGRAPKTNYARAQFGDGWTRKNGCDTRNIILNRDLTGSEINSKCQVVRGQLSDPYTGETIAFRRGASTSAEVQINHVVALSDAWQKGAQQLSAVQREALANDPLELLAVSGEANQRKSDGDAATWLPSNKSFRCQYVARQIAVKHKYTLWVTVAEKDAMKKILTACPGEPLPSSRD